TSTRATDPFYGSMAGIRHKWPDSGGRAAQGARKYPEMRSSRLARGLLLPSLMQLHSPNRQSFAQSFWNMAQPPLGNHESLSRAAARAVVHVARAWAQEGSDSLGLDEPGYAAPEALRGEPADRRAGIFTLGVLLFERVTNQHPFGEDLRTRMERM